MSQPRPNGGWKGQRGTRQQRGYGRAWEKTRKAIIARDNAMCQPCLRQGRVTPFAEVDHIKPKARGGPDDNDNLQCICIDCHRAKTTAEGHGAKGNSLRRISFDAQGNPIWPD